MAFKHAVTRERVNKGTCVTGGKYFVWCLKYDDKARKEEKQKEWSKSFLNIFPSASPPSSCNLMKSVSNVESKTLFDGNHLK